MSCQAVLVHRVYSEEVAFCPYIFPLLVSAGGFGLWCWLECKGAVFGASCECTVWCACFWSATGGCQGEEVDNVGQGGRLR
jgi:hypothetical protein